MSEHDAHSALTATAQLRVGTLKAHDTYAAEAQLMTFSQRQYRAREACGLYVAGLAADTVAQQINACARVLGFWPPTTYDFRDHEPAQDYLSVAARRGFTDEG